jgi:hypothetical protein
VLETVPGEATLDGFFLPTGGIPNLAPPFIRNAPSPSRF